MWRHKSVREAGACVSGGRCIGLLILTGLFWAGTPFTVQAQNTTHAISGYVYDAQTHQPLEYTNVYIDSLPIGSATLRNGSFVVRGVPPGRHTLVVNRIGYREYRKKVTVSGDVTGLRIALRPGVLQGDAVTVTASIREQTGQMAPADIYLMDHARLTSQPFHTFDQALAAVPGIQIYRTSGTSVQSLSIRGSSDVAGGGVGNRVLLLIDGRPALSSDTGGALWSLVPMGAIDHVEILKGAFSSLYGSSAMGGVVNVITRQPAYKRETHIRMGSGLYEPLPKKWQFRSSPSLYSVLEASHSGVVGPLSYLFHVSRNSSDGHAENTAFTFYNLYGRMIYDLSEKRYLDLSLSGTHSSGDYPHTWKNNLHPYQVLDKYKDDTQVKQQFALDVRYRAYPSDKVNYSARVFAYRNANRSYFNQNDPEYRIPGNQTFGLESRVDADKYGFIARLDAQPWANHKMIMGADVQADVVHSSPDSVMYGNRRVNNLAFFVQDEWTPVSFLTATLGIRYDVNTLVGGKQLQQWSSNAALLWRINKAFSARLLFGQGFRAPSIAERFFQKELNGGTLFKPNPGLRAEKIDVSLESGLRWRPSEKFRLNAAWFRYHYTDMIYWVEISGEVGVVYTLFQVRNLNKALIQGVELDMSWLPVENLQCTAAYTFLDARDQSPGRTDDYLAYRVRHGVKAGVRYTHGDYALSVNVRYKSKVDEVFLYPLEAPKAYWVMNSRLQWRVSSMLTLALDVNNIFNASYEELARYKAPNRNYLLSLNLDW
ncbi:MAG: PEGA domain-containing protein [Calditrichaeota bacterium]|nr:MAG: PEGA domain-containing protein [Calditrichota bacterium]